VIEFVNWYSGSINQLGPGVQDNLLSWGGVVHSWSAWLMQWVLCESPPGHRDAKQSRLDSFIRHKCYCYWWCNLKQVGQYPFVESTDTFRFHNCCNSMGCVSIGKSITHGSLHLHAATNYIQWIRHCVCVCVGGGDTVRCLCVYVCVGGNTGAFTQELVLDLSQLHSEREVVVGRLGSQWP